MLYESLFHARRSSILVLSKFYRLGSGKHRKVNNSRNKWQSGRVLDVPQSLHFTINHETVHYSPFTINHYSLDRFILYYSNHLPCREPTAVLSYRAEAGTQDWVRKTEVHIQTILREEPFVL